MSNRHLSYEREMQGVRHATEVFLPSWAGFNAGITVGIVVNTVVNSEALALGSGVTAGAIAFAGLRRLAQFINSAE